MNRFNISSISPRFRVLSFVGVLVLVGGIYVASTRVGPVGKASGSSTPTENSNARGIASESEDLPSTQVASKGSAARRGSVGVSHPFPGIAKSRANLPLETDPFPAQSRAEQRWLDRNGFPNAEQWQTYSTASDALLAQAADAGDEIADVMMQGRALARGDVSASDRLLAAAANGSSFALSTLAAYMAGSSKGNREAGYALSRVAEMRGDYRLAAARDVMFAKPLTLQERLNAEAEAVEIFNKLRSSSSIGNKFVDPRPINP